MCLNAIAVQEKMQRVIDDLRESILQRDLTIKSLKEEIERLQWSKRQQEEQDLLDQTKQSRSTPEDKVAGVLPEY